MVTAGRWADKQKEEAEAESKDKPWVGTGSIEAESDQVGNRRSTQET